jgi:Na+/melibiose symporter-like transporter
MDQLRPSTRTRLRNLTLAAIAGMAGVVTLIVVLTALLIGLWIDSRFDQRGPFTFALLCLSIPVSLFLMLRLTLSALNRIQTQPVRTWGRSSPSEEE